MFRMSENLSTTIRLFILTIVLLLVATTSWATFPDDPGFFVIRGFSNAHLIWLPSDNSTPTDLGALGAGATRVHIAAGFILITHAGSLSTGAGSSLWYAPLSEIGMSIRQHRSPNWTVCPFADFSNAYDVAYANGFAWVTLLGTNQLTQVNLTTNTIVATQPTVANPQDILTANNKLYVSGSGFGSGRKVGIHYPGGQSRDSITVGINPQGLAVNPATGIVYVACSGSSWGNPTVPGSIAIIRPDNSDTVLSLPQSAFYPSSVTMTASGSIYFADEYSTPHLVQLTEPTPSHFSITPLQLSGGWSLLAAPDSGIFIASSTTNTICHYSATQQLLQTFNPGGVPAGLVFWSGQSTTSVEQEPAQLTNYTILRAYPNPFNAQSTIEYRLPNATDVRVTVTDLQGREIAVLTTGVEPAGMHRIRFDGSTFASGTYYLVLTANQVRSIRPLQLVK